VEVKKYINKIHVLYGGRIVYHVGYSGNYQTKEELIGAWNGRNEN